MFYPNLKDFFESLEKTNIPIKVVYPSKSDEEITLNVSEEETALFYPTLANYIVETNEMKKLPGKGISIDECDAIISPSGMHIDMKYLNGEMGAARVAIISEAALWAPLVNELTPIYTFQVPTMATDGARLFVNPEFAMGLSFLHKIFVLIHEIMHSVLNHRIRMGMRQKMVVAQKPDGTSSEPITLWNIAADYEINAIIVDTEKHFSEADIKAIHGLYDKKYLNMAAEPIYDELEKKIPNFNMPPQGPPPPCGGKGEPPCPPPPPPPELKVGSKVRIKPTGEKGIVSKLNPDGTFEVEPLPVKESFIERLLEAVAVKYNRDELIPILPPPQGGGGGSGGDDQDSPEVEYEECGSPGQPPCPEGEGEPEKDENGNPLPAKARGFKNGKEVELAESGTKVFVEPDPGGTGIHIDKKAGDKIAKRAGHALKDEGDLDRRWSDHGRKLLEDIEKSTTGAGSGAGGMLKSALRKLFKPDVNWQDEFKRIVAKALSPEKRWRLGNRKHMRAGQKIMRYGRKQKRDQVDNVTVCVDVSGSMSEVWKAKILNEVNAIIMANKVKEIIVIFFDGVVDLKSVQTIKRKGKPFIPDYIPGGGGTLFQNPLDYIELKLNNQVGLCVFATDGYNFDDGYGEPGSIRTPPYSNKFIWLIYGSMSTKEVHYRFPFGKVIKIVQKTDDDYEP